MVPRSVSHLQACAAELDDDPNTTYVLEAISWDGVVDVSQHLNAGINQHRVVAQVLEEEDEEENADGYGDVGESQKRGVAKLCRLEATNRQLQEVLSKVERYHGSQLLQCRERICILDAGGSMGPLGENGYLCSLQPPPPADSSPLQPPTEEFLQTKTIPNDVVRNELEKWKPAILAEYQSLVHETKAVRPLSDSEFLELTKKPGIKCELIPGRAIFTVKAQTGRLKARVVACGCFQTGETRTKEDTFASGISAESVRMLIRLAGLRGFKIGSLDI